MRFLKSLLRFVSHLEIIIHPFVSLRLVGFASPNHLKQTFGQAINHWWAGPLLTTQRKTTHTHRHKNGLQIIQNKGCVVVYQGKRRVRVGRVSNFVIFCQVLYCCTFCNCQYIYILSKLFSSFW